MPKTESRPDIQSDHYYSIASHVSAELRVKGSRFIATLFPVIDKEQAEEKYAAIRTAYHDATHNCFAYRINDDQFRLSDDGEPSGSAGKPILQALDAKNLREVICIVTRYFGGTKLGVGGLIRAYGESSRLVIEESHIITRLRMNQFRVISSFASDNSIRHLIHELRGNVIHAEYLDRLIITAELPASGGNKFREGIIEVTAGQAEVSLLE